MDAQQGRDSQLAVKWVQLRLKLRHSVFVGAAIDSGKKPWESEWWWQYFWKKAREGRCAGAADSPVGLAVDKDGSHPNAFVWCSVYAITWHCDGRWIDSTFAE